MAPSAADPPSDRPSGEAPGVWGSAPRGDSDRPSGEAPGVWGSAPDVEVVRRFTAGLSSGDLDTCLALVHEDLVFSEAESLPFGGDRTGRQGLLDLLAAVSRDYRVRLSEPVIAQAGDRVLVRVAGTIASRATGRQLPLQVLDLYEVRDGRIARVDVFYKDAAAVTALCLADEPTMTGSAAT